MDQAGARSRLQMSDIKPGMIAMVKIPRPHAERVTRFIEVTGWEMDS